MQQKHNRSHGEHQGHHTGHDHQHMVADFRKRFWVAANLTVPVLFLSPMIQDFLGIRDYLAFPGDGYVLFILSSLIFFYGGWPFLKGIYSELSKRKPGMMTLIAIAITVAYVYSSVVTFGVQGCIVWGGSVALSPADDILIRVERAMDLDSEGQLIASVLSKKISAGSTHIAIDIPVGPTAKVRSLEKAQVLKKLFELAAQALGIQLTILFSDGLQPVGRGIGPALEAHDVLAVLQNQEEAPQDLRDRALTLAGSIIEFSSKINPGEGKGIATQLLDEGKAWKKFQAICKAQGGLREPSMAAFTHPVTSKHCGRVASIDNRQLARLAKLAGAPHDKAAGITLHTPLETTVEKDQPLFTIHAESKGELHYALSLLKQISDVVQVETCE